MAGGVKRKIPIQKRETKQQRAVAFSKRRQGLFKKAAELCNKFGAQVAVIATGPSEKSSSSFYSFGHSSVDDVLDTFLHNRRPEETTGTSPSSSGDSSSVISSELLEVYGYLDKDVDTFENAEEVANAMETIRRYGEEVERELHAKRSKSDYPNPRHDISDCDDVCQINSKIINYDSSSNFTSPSDEKLLSQDIHTNTHTNGADLMVKEIGCVNGGFAYTESWGRYDDQFWNANANLSGSIIISDSSANSNSPLEESLLSLGEFNFYQDLGFCSDLSGCVDGVFANANLSGGIINIDGAFNVSNLYEQGLGFCSDLIIDGNTNAAVDFMITQNGFCNNQLEISNANLMNGAVADDVIFGASVDAEFWKIYGEVAALVNAD